MADAIKHLSTLRWAFAESISQHFCLKGHNQSMCYIMPYDIELIVGIALYASLAPSGCRGAWNCPNQTRVKG